MSLDVSDSPGAASERGDVKVRRLVGIVLARWQFFTGVLGFAVTATTFYLQHDAEQTWKRTEISICSSAIPGYRFFDSGANRQDSCPEGLALRDKGHC